MTEPLYSSCIRGARSVLSLARASLSYHLARRGADAPIGYPDTAYELPVAFGLTDLNVTTLGGAEKLLGLAEGLLRNPPTLENALDAGAATLLSAEVLGALSHKDGNPFPPPSVGFIPDSILRRLGIFMVDGSVPGVAVVIGRATDPAAAAAMIRQFQEIGLLVFLAGDVVSQMNLAGVKLGDDFRTFPLGPLPAVIHAVNFAVRAGLTFGGLGRGQTAAMYAYLANRVKAFVCALGPLDEIALAVAAGAIKAGFPVLSDQNVPEIPGVLFRRPAGEEMVRTGMEARGIKVKIVKVPIPIAFGPAYEGERIRKSDTHAEFGGGRSTASLRHSRRCGTGRSRSPARTSLTSRRAGRSPWGSWSRSRGTGCRRTSSRCWSGGSTASSTTGRGRCTWPSGTPRGSACPARRLPRGLR